MKKLLALLLVLVLCAGTAACAETTVQATEIEADNLEMNTKANTFIQTDRNAGVKRITDAELNPLSEDYAYISTEEEYYTAANEDLHTGLLDSQGKLVLPLEYGDIELISERWIAGIKLVESQDSEENPDYRSFFGGGSYMIDTVDIYYAGEKKGTVARKDWKSVKAFGDYLCITNRDGNPVYYNKDFAESGAETDYSYEYNNDYSTKTITHLGSGQAAFTEGCTLTPDEVMQSVWINNDKQLLDLQGNIIADLSAYRSAYVDAESNLIKVENEDGKKGLADRNGKEIVACLYDSISYALNSALKSGYLYAEKDGKSGFVNLATGAETGFVFTKDAGSQRANFILVDDSREGKILISAAAGELPGRYEDTNASFPNKGDRCPYAVVKGKNEEGCRVVGQLGEDILPGVTFNSIYDAAISEDGTMILARGERGHYTLYTISYDPDLSAVPTAGENAGEETWTCENGHAGLTGNFCPECGAKKPE